MLNNKRKCVIHEIIDDRYEYSVKHIKCAIKSFNHSSANVNYLMNILSLFSLYFISVYQIEARCIMGAM